MLVLDVNVLIYAFREDAEDHARYRDWLEGLLNGPARFGTHLNALLAVVRITTNARINKNPSKLTDVFEFVDQIRNAPTHVAVETGPRHWEVFEGLCKKLKLTGTITTDAWFAALAIEGGHEWVTTDRDFARFPGLRWSHPLERPKTG
jgi:toxin-antitoxin system PIN domain toxin